MNLDYKNIYDEDKMIEELVNNAKKALDEYMKLDQKSIDKIVHAMAIAGQSKHMHLAKMAVEETKRGVYEDKIIKNIFATEYIWNSIKREKTVGIIKEDDFEGYVEIVEPIGIIAGVTPVTNPTSTTLFKSLISVKTRNPIIFAFHPSSQKCSVEAAKIVRDVAIKLGAPQHCIQWIQHPSIKATHALMNNPNISLILATGGSAMVKAAYSAGKPALGVGPGNVPCYIEKSANLKRACTDIILSKTFDNGMICASEQSVIVDDEISEQFENYMKNLGCYFLNDEETIRVNDILIDKENMTVNSKLVGQSGYFIASAAGVSVPENTKILIAKLPYPSYDYPLSLEKLSPVLAYFTVKNKEQGFKYALDILNLGGLGHTAVIHSLNDDICKEYGLLMRVGRIIVNSPSSQGAIGNIYNTNTPSLTLGCGSFGKNSTTDNISVKNLLNKKKVAKRRVNMQWFKVPPKIYFENNSIEYLEKMPDISRAFIVTDPMMLKLGYADKILHYLRKRPQYCHSEIFSEVEPNPSVETVMNGVKLMKNFKPDVIIALGGGSAMDAAKGMWLFYEHPEVDFDNLKLKFMDIRKRLVEFPKIGNKVKFVAVPTTSGTGSEVTGFAVITDKKNGNIKYPLADYELTPDVAIIDPQFVETLPKTVVADTGMDVLTHAIEAYVSILASDYTDGLAMKAIELVFEYLEKSYNDPNDKTAKEKMHNASCLAGMAFSNAFLGINHSLAHKLGGEYNISHGRSNAVLLPYVIKYNASMPTKFSIWPKYEHFIADKKYAEIAKRIGLQFNNTDEGIKMLIDSIIGLMKKLNMPLTIKDCGIDEKRFLNNLPKLAEIAFEDQCTTANPRYPLVTELIEIYKSAYYGKLKNVD